MTGKPTEITPRSKVGEILEKYPELEETLISLSPAFEKLRNPVLRKTIARVATLQQIAAVGNIPLETIVNSLRHAAGQNQSEENMTHPADLNNLPAWLDESRIEETLDARQMLARGEHPLAIVLGKVNELPSGKIFELITPFLPSPLIDKVKATGAEACVKETAPGEFRSFFCKP